jgi:uncharacterized membrane protein (DUF485 family)
MLRASWNTRCFIASHSSVVASASSTAMAVTYFAYILTIAFRPTLLGTPLFEGSVVTWGVVIGAGLLSFGFVLTAVYVLVANTRLDAISQRLQEDLK